MTNSNSNSIQSSTDLAFLLNHNFGIIKDKLEKIYAVAYKTKWAEKSLPEDNQDLSTIFILEIIEELASDFTCVYEIENLLKELTNANNGGVIHNG